MQPLVTVSEFESWVGTQSGTVNDALASTIINGWTQFVYWKTGRTPDLFVEEVQFTETRDGNGSNVLYLMNEPIVSVSSVLVNNRAIPQSSGYGAGGWFIQQNQDSIGMRSGTSGIPGFHQGNPYIFSRGKGNVLITYTAGYSSVPPDLYLATEKACTVLWDRRLREDQGSKNTEAGTTSYRSWPWPPDAVQMLNNYRRTAMIGA